MNRAAERVNRFQGAKMKQAGQSEAIAIIKEVILARNSMVVVEVEYMDIYQR